MRYIKPIKTYITDAIDFFCFIQGVNQNRSRGSNNGRGYGQANVDSLNI